MSDKLKRDINALMRSWTTEYMLNTPVSRLRQQVITIVNGPGGTPDVACRRCGDQGYVPDLRHMDHNGEPTPKPCPNCQENTP